MKVELVKKVVNDKKDKEKKYTNLFLIIDNVSRPIQIKPSFKDSKSDFILLVNLATDLTDKDF